MKIAAVSSSKVPATTANSIQLMKVCHALQRVSGSLRLWVPGSASTTWEVLAQQYGLAAPFEVAWLPGQRIFRRYDMAWEAVQQAVEWGADLIYTWMPQAAVMGLLRGRPVILEMHDLPTGRLGPLLFAQFARHPGRKRLLIITHALRWALERDYRLTLRSDQVQIAPNGIDLEQYNNLPSQPEARQQLGLPAGQVVLYSGHFYAGRGMNLLYGLAQHFPQVTFVWVGGREEDVAAWQAHLQADGCQNVILTGFVENCRLPLYQAAAEILLMPYERAIEGSSGGNSAAICSPMKMFDYLAAGKAILASDLPVLHEVLNPANACFAPPEDLPAWVLALGELLANETLRRRLGGQAITDSARYTWEERAKKALKGFE